MPIQVSTQITEIINNIDIKTDELDNLLAETAAYLNMLHPDCGRLAARISVTALHKNTNEKFSDTIE